MTDVDPLDEIPLGARFWRKVEVGDCWRWTAGLSQKGYGRFKLDGRSRAAHRLAYEALVGPVPAGLQIDHLCKNRPCINPDHLDVVTPRENARRGAVAVVARARQRALTSCSNGHEYAKATTSISRAGHRTCRICKRANDAKRVPRGRLAAA